MGYDLHITRASDWFDSLESPITRAEWTAVAVELRLAVNGQAGDDPLYEVVASDGSVIPVQWIKGRVVAYGSPHSDGAARALARLATRLNARLIGDDGEQYDPETGKALPA
ncbi:MAG: hypothetical protein HOQ24_13155 [Mycobacteriaceae bacterium]|nr:hypothetical protein [Mycobacteriaceae bacterium]